MNKKNIALLSERFPHLKISEVKIPEKETLNEFYIKYGSGAILELIEERTQIAGVVVSEIEEPALKEESGGENTQDETPGILDCSEPQKLVYKAEKANYTVLGNLPSDLGTLKVLLLIEERASRITKRKRLDLYNQEETEMFCKEVEEKTNLRSEELEADMMRLTDLLAKHQEKVLADSIPEFQKSQRIVQVSQVRRDACIEFLRQPNLLGRIDQLIEKAGVVGEENNRKLLYVIASSYRMPDNLHAIITGTSGSGKTHLISAIADCFPKEQYMPLTRISSKALYYYKKDELINKLIAVQDWDGLTGDAAFAFRELQSAGFASSAIPLKDQNGNPVSGTLFVYGHFASFIATTKEAYFDNVSRSLTIGVSEDMEQTRRIVNYQNRKIAGQIDILEEQNTKELLRDCYRCLKSYVVINRFADKVELPTNAKMLRRLNMQFQLVVKQVTLLNQYQRKTDEEGRLITELEDLETACDILLDAIVLRVDELDSGIRQFYERLKDYVLNSKNGKKSTFSLFEIRSALNQSKTQLFRYMEELVQLEYVQKAGGHKNKGFVYKIGVWDDAERLREGIKEGLQTQLKALKP